MKKRTFITVFCFGAMLLLSACGGGSNSDKLQVVSTTSMIHDAVTAIGGAHVEAVSLMGPGIDPHLYKASEGDVRKLANAKMIFYNGLHLEAKMGEVLEKMSVEKPVVPVGEAIPEEKLRSPKEFKGQHDPHVWFDVSLWHYAAMQVRDALIVADPTHKEDYRKNAAVYLAQLRELDAWVKVEVQKVPTATRVLVTAHDAFGYFGRAYGFEVKGLQGISTEAEAGTKDVQKLAELIVSRKINAVFIESSVPQRNIEAVQAAAKSKGWDVKIGGSLFADAMGDLGTPEGTYVGMVKHNVNTIVKALQNSQEIAR